MVAMMTIVMMMMMTMMKFVLTSPFFAAVYEGTWTVGGRVDIPAEYVLVLGLHSTTTA